MNMQGLMTLCKSSSPRPDTRTSPSDETKLKTYMHQGFRSIMCGSWVNLRPPGEKGVHVLRRVPEFEDHSTRSVEPHRKSKRYTRAGRRVYLGIAGGCGRTFDGKNSRRGLHA